MSSDAVTSVGNANEYAATVGTADYKVVRLIQNARVRNRHLLP